MAKLTKEQLAKDYDHVTVINGLAAVRKRPGMYIGSPRSLDGQNPQGLIHIAQEVLSNAIDEAYAGFGNEIQMIVHKDNSMTIIDQGRGLPTGGKDLKSAIQSATVLHASGKFDNKSYANALGTNGVGMTSCNATSKYFDIVAVTTKNEHYHLKLNGEKVVEKEFLPYKKGMHTGTTITFLPDDTFFDTIDWDDEPLINKMEQSAFLTPNVKFIFIDERKPYQGDDGKHEHYYQEWYSKNGMPDYVAYIAQSEDLVKGLKKPIAFKGDYDYSTAQEPTHGKDNKNLTGTISVEGALIYTESTGSTAFSFVNGGPTPQNGTHVDGANAGIAQAFKDYVNNFRKQLKLKKTQNIDTQDTRDGLILSLLVKLPENIMMFDSQSKTRLVTPEAKDATKQIVYNQLSAWLADHPKIAKAIIENMIDSKNAREAALKAKRAARQARKTKNGNGKLFVSSNLKKATSSNPKEKELYIVEGLSAAGSLIKARNPKTQAIFPIKGKILNTEGLKLARVIKNPEISTIASVLKAGIGSVFEPEELDYDKVIINSDADPDGYAIRALLITLFFNFFPKLIEQGHLYYVNAPLFKISHYVKGKQINDFVYTEEERDKKLKELGAKANPSVSRFKGLGEMSVDEAKLTLLGPKTRYLTQVTSNDAQDAKEALKLMMGKDAKPRKAWIEKNVDFDGTTE